jgi:hypothetical protein
VYAEPSAVVVADGAKVRFFSLKEKGVGGELCPYLIEDEALLNPEQKLPGQQL